MLDAPYYVLRIPLPLELVPPVIPTTIERVAERSVFPRQPFDESAKKGGCHCAVYEMPSSIIRRVSFPIGKTIST